MMTTRSKLRLGNLQHTGHVFLLTEPVFKLMMKVIKDDFIISKIQDIEQKYKDPDFVKRINKYMKRKSELTLEYINNKEAENNLRTRNKVFKLIKNAIIKKKITFKEINDKDSEFYLDENKQTYYYNLWKKIFTKPTKLLEKGTIAFPGFTIKPAPTTTSYNREHIPLLNEKNKKKIGGYVLLGTTPRPPNLLHNIHYVVPSWSEFNRARQDLHIYSTQLPYQFNRFIMLQTFIKYMYVHEIKVLLNLQGCDTNTNHGNNYDYLNPDGKGCNIDDMDSEGKIWELTKHITEATQNDTNIKYITAGIADFDPGSLDNWDKIFSNVGDTKSPDNKIVIHCLAGLGRTGSVVLSLLMRDFINPQWLHHNIRFQHLNYGTIQNLIYELKNLFNINTESRKIFNELFDTGDVNRKILRPRINCILYSIAKYYQFNSFSLYNIVPNAFDMDSEFSDMREMSGIDWNTHTHTQIPDIVINAFFK